jgi:hypothetical protein
MKSYRVTYIVEILIDALDPDEALDLAIDELKGAPEGSFEVEELQSGDY